MSDDYDPADDARKCYDAAIAAKKARGDKHYPIPFSQLPWRRKEVIGDCTLYLGDCLEILPTLGKVDAVVTDPPYGVRLGEDGPTAIGKTAYASFEDTPEYIKTVCVPVIEMCVELFGRAVLTPGNRNCFSYPQPSEIGAIFNPAGAGFSRWGFTTSQPILYYGKDPHSPKKKPQAVYSTELSEKNGHPCPKPIKLMKWMVDRGSLPGETVLDPFMGSGTTGVACVKLGRSFIGIEIDEGYFNIAVDRIKKAYAQPDFFVEQAKPDEPKQTDIFGEAAE